MEGALVVWGGAMERAVEVGGWVEILRSANVTDHFMAALKY